MGYFDALVDGVFKKNDLGNIVFYPWDVLGSGFVVPTEQDRARIHAFCVRSHMVSITTVIGLQFFVPLWVIVATMPCYFVWWHYSVRRITANLPITKERLGLGEYYRQSARAHSLAMLVLGEFFAIVFVVGGVFLLSAKRD